MYCSTSPFTRQSRGKGGGLGLFYPSYARLRSFPYLCSYNGLLYHRVSVLVFFGLLGFLSLLKIQLSVMYVFKWIYRRVLCMCVIIVFMRQLQKGMQVGVRALVHFFHIFNSSAITFHLQKYPIPFRYTFQPHEKSTHFNKKHVSKKNI